MSEQPEGPNPRTLLADLESRQEELLRLLDDLEQRTKQALARLSVVDPQAAASPEGAVGVTKTGGKKVA